ncbi:hypothetical protein [Streptomyces halstedii]|uniref:hypothetical protein n=1 Tax=Streptomyces halstedii TaxID=1944 RepID=UPI003675C540
MPKEVGERVDIHALVDRLRGEEVPESVHHLVAARLPPTPSANRLFVHRGTVPEQAEAVLVRVERTAESSYRLIDQLLAEGAGHGA